MLSVVFLAALAAVSLMPGQVQGLIRGFDIDDPGYVLQEGEISAFAVTKDFTRFAMSSKYHYTVNIYSMNRPWVERPMEPIAYNKFASALAFNSDGSKLAAIAQSLDVVKVYLTRGEKELDRALRREGQKLLGMSEFFMGEHIATSSEDGTITIWDVESGSIYSEFNFKTGSIHTVAASEDGKYITFGLEESKQVAVFEPGKGAQAQHELLPQTRECSNARAMKISRNMMAVGCLDFSIRIYDLESRKQLGAMMHDLPGFSFAFSERYLVSGSFDASVRVWSLKTFKGIDYMDWSVHRYPIVGVGIAWNGSTVVTANRDVVRLWRRNVTTEELADRELYTASTCGDKECAASN